MLALKRCLFPIVFKRRQRRHSKNNQEKKQEGLRKNDAKKMTAFAKDNG